MVDQTAGHDRVVRPIPIRPTMRLVQRPQPDCTAHHEQIRRGDPGARKRPHGREASSHDVEVTTSPTRTSGQIRRWRQYLADERSEAAGYRRLAERRTGEEREILLALADAEKRHESHWLDLLGDDVGQPRRRSLRTRLLVFLAAHFGGVFVLALMQRAEGRSPYEREVDATDR